MKTKKAFILARHAFMIQLPDLLVATAICLSIGFVNAMIITPLINSMPVFDFRSTSHAIGQIIGTYRTITIFYATLLALFALTNIRKHKLAALVAVFHAVLTAAICTLISVSASAIISV